VDIGYDYHNVAWFWRLYLGAPKPCYAVNGHSGMLKANFWGAGTMLEAAVSAKGAGSITGGISSKISQLARVQKCGE